MKFKVWLENQILQESKGIMLDASIKSQLESSLDKIYEKAKEVKQNPAEELEVYDVASIKFKDPYVKDKERQVDIHVVKAPHQNFHGNFRPGGFGIEINVAHVEEKDLTPKWIERVLAHELIHSIDPKISDFDTYSRMGARNYDSSGVSYYTQPLEYDAYTGQLVYSITTAAQRYKDTDKEPILRKQLDDTLKFISNPEKSKSEKIYGFIGDPEYWRYYHIYLSHGSAQQKTKMQQRIYKAIMNAKATLDQKRV